MEPYPLGWLEEEEHQHTEHLAPFTVPEFLCSAPASIPDTLDVPFLQRTQGYTPFCHGFMRRFVEVCLAWLATNGQVYNFSPYYAAVGDMIMDGNASRPVGASIGGSLRASLSFGSAEEQYQSWPAIFNTENYARGYNGKLLAPAQDNAKMHHMQSVVPGVRSYDDMDKALSSGACCMGYGLTWTTGFDALRGVTTADHVPGGTVRGGHAQAAFGWITKAGERWYYNHNSHDGWGVRNRIAYSPSMWDKILKNSRYGAFICSNIKLDDAKPIAAPGWDWLAGANFGGNTQLNLHS